MLPNISSANLVGDGGPHLDNLVGALAVVMRRPYTASDFDHLLSRLDGVYFESGMTMSSRPTTGPTCGVIEAQRLDAVKHADRDFKAEIWLQ